MNATAKDKASSTTTTDEVRGVLIQIVGSQLLLPNASTVEVLSYADPEPIENVPADSVPDWMLGQIRWRGWKVPMLAYSRMVGTGSESTTVGIKVVVLKALGGDAKLPYFSILAQGFPRLVTINRDALIVDASKQDDDNETVRMRVMFNDDLALVPDLDAIERMILQVTRPVDPAESEESAA